MKWFVLMIALIMASPAIAQETPVPIVRGDLIVSPVADQPQAGRLRLLERRRMGLTAKNVIRVLQEMKASGELAQYSQLGADGVKEIDVSNLAAAVAGQLASERPADWSDIDWDQVLIWIEKILELLIKFLPIIIDLFV